MHQRDPGPQAGVEGAGEAGGTGELHGLLLRHEDVLQHGGVAARALQAGDGPGVLDGPVGGRQADDADQRRPALDRPLQGLAGLGDDAGADDEVGVLAARGEGPFARNPVAAFHPLGAAARRPGEARLDHVRSMSGEDAVEGRARHAREDQGRGRTNHHRPAGRAVGPGDLGDHLQALGEIELQPAVRVRGVHAEDARRLQLGHQVRRDAAQRLRLGRSRPDLRRQGADLVQHLVG